MRPLEAQGRLQILEADTQSPCFSGMALRRDIRVAAILTKYVLSDMAVMVDRVRVLSRSDGSNPACLDVLSDIALQHQPYESLVWSIAVWEFSSPPYSAFWPWLAMGMSAIRAMTAVCVQTDMA